MNYYVYCGLLDINLKDPHDTRIRESASEAGGPFAEDPGNVCWDVMFGVTRLWKYVSDTGEWRVLRTDTQEYGSQSNKSSKGSCNFRGNILESLQCRLQKLASETNAHTQHVELARADADVVTGVHAEGWCRTQTSCFYCLCVIRIPCVCRLRSMTSVVAK